MGGALCRSRTYVVKGIGAIDVEGARDAIKQIMEGGEAAFRLRRKKYGL